MEGQGLVFGCCAMQVCGKRQGTVLLVGKKVAHVFTGRKENRLPLKLSWKHTQKPSALIITLIPPEGCKHVTKGRGGDGWQLLEEHDGPEKSFYPQ